MTHIRHVPENIVSHIKQMAAGGFSIHAISMTLEMDRRSLIRVLNNHGIKTKVWDSFDKKNAYANMDNSVRKVNMKAVAKNRAKKYTVNGTTDTFPELVAKFAVVHEDTVRARMKRGFTLEAALFTPSLQLATLRANNKKVAANKNSQYRKNNSMFFNKR